MNRDNTKGFTLIELMLAMTFISVLLIAIAMTTIQMSNIYTKGITLREVNQAGRTLSDDLQRSIGASAPFDLAATGNQASYAQQQTGGRLCVGKYSYIWNYGDSISEAQNPQGLDNHFNNDNTFIRFIKVSDPDRSLCIRNAQNELEEPIKSESRELLSEGDRDLAIHSFRITETAREAATSQAMYAITFTLGTNDQAQLTTNDSSCRPPSDNVGAEDYCSVNQFDIVARAGNQSEGQ